MQLFDRLVSELGAEVDRSGRAHADCPFCGKPAKKNQTHFSFWQAGASHSQAGAKCFTCQTGMGLGNLANHLDLPNDQKPTTARQMPQEARKPANWCIDPAPYLARYQRPLGLFAAWADYKRISPASVGAFNLGLGPLPFIDDDDREFFGRYPRLIIPTFVAGQCVAIEGRAIHPADTGPKWLCATRSRKDVLFGAERLWAGATVVIPENKADCILAMQELPGVVAVTAGGSSWREEWTAQIVASRPARVVVWRDNDLVGQPNAPTQAAQLAAWHEAAESRAAAYLAKTGRALAPQSPPTAIGPSIADQFIAAGVETILYQWPTSAPAKADMGSVLLRRLSNDKQIPTPPVDS